MPEQNDKLVQFFNERGYQPVLLARTDLAPPDVYDLRDGAYERLGPLMSFLEVETSIFTPVVADATDFEHAEANTHDSKLSISFFKSLLKHFGLGSSEGKAKIAADVSSAYRFKDVSVRTVDVVDIDKALEAGSLRSIFRAEAERGSIHIAYEYLYAGKVQISHGDHDDVAVGLSADLPQMASVETSASHLGKDTSSIAYQNSNRPVVIAFKVGQLVQSGGKWKLKVGRSSLGFDPLSARNIPYIYQSGEILRIEEGGIQGEGDQ